MPSNNQIRIHQPTASPLEPVWLDLPLVLRIIDSNSRIRPSMILKRPRFTVPRQIGRSDSSTSEMRPPTLFYVGIRVPFSVDEHASKLTPRVL